MAKTCVVQEIIATALWDARGEGLVDVHETAGYLLQALREEGFRVAERERPWERRETVDTVRQTGKP